MHHQLLRIQIQLLLAATAATGRIARARDERGQATAEYALVLLAAAAIAGLLATWALRSGAVGRLLDAVFDRLLAKGDPTG